MQIFPNTDLQWFDGGGGTGKLIRTLEHSEAELWELYQSNLLLQSFQSHSDTKDLSKM